MENFYQKVFQMKTFWKNDADKAYLTTGNGDIFGLLQTSDTTNGFEINKINSNNSKLQDMFNQIYFDFKIDNKLTKTQIYWFLEVFAGAPNQMGPV